MSKIPATFVHKLRPVFGSLQKPQIFRPGQFLFLRRVGLALGLQALYPAVFPSQKAQQTVQAGKHGIYGAHRVPFFRQGLLPAPRQLLCYPGPAAKCTECPRVPDIFIYSSFTFFFLLQIGAELFYPLFVQDSLIHFGSFPMFCEIILIVPNFIRFLTRFFF